MSKYNNMKSIPIDSIPEEEMAQAIKEWAEGDESMERLLWTCYKKGIKTSGCHAGGSPYIDFTDQENINKISGLMDVTQKIEGSQILIKVDGGNPFSGAEWHLPNILLHLQTSYKDEADAFFDKLTNSLLQEEHSFSLSLYSASYSETSVNSSSRWEISSASFNESTKAVLQSGQIFIPSTYSSLQLGHHGIVVTPLCQNDHLFFK